MEMRYWLTHFTSLLELAFTVSMLALTSCPVEELLSGSRVLDQSLRRSKTQALPTSCLPPFQRCICHQAARQSLKQDELLRIKWGLQGFTRVSSPLDGLDLEVSADEAEHHALQILQNTK